MTSLNITSAENMEKIFYPPKIREVENHLSIFQIMKCHLCNKKAIGRLSPDMDLKGFGFCKEHKYKMTTNYMMLFSENSSIRKRAEKFFQRIK